MDPQAHSRVPTLISILAVLAALVAFPVAVTEAQRDPGALAASLSAPGYHSCGVRADGSIACWGESDAGQAPGLSLQPASPPDGQPGQAYSHQLSVSASRYTPPAPAFVVTGGTLPDGLSLSASGLLGGTPSRFGSRAFTVQVSDANGFQARRAYTLVINSPPVADAWAPQQALVGETVRLDGSGSYDPDGHTPLMYYWQQTGGPAVVLSEKTAISPSFTAPEVPAVLTFKLVVSDRYGRASAPATVAVRVELIRSYLPLVVQAAPSSQSRMGAAPSLQGVVVRPAAGVQPMRHV